MRKVIILIILILSLNVFAQEHNLEEARRLIESKVPCSKLTNDQLETIGDYYMEQMHPGEAHEVMDKMMGGEGSENLRNVHINMAKSFYCGNNNAMSQGMMNMMMNRGGSNMMGNYYGMMNYPFGWSFGFIFMIIFWGLVIWLVVWLIKNYSSKSESSLEILKKRYAKGEITKKQFEEIKRELGR